MVGRSVQKFLRTWLGLVFMVSKKRGVTLRRHCLLRRVHRLEENFSFGTSDETVQAVKVPFAREPQPSWRGIHHPTDLCRCCYLVKDILWHPTHSESSQG